jgi:hypothetical protein
MRKAVSRWKIRDPRCAHARSRGFLGTTRDGSRSIAPAGMRFLALPQRGRPTGSPLRHTWVTMLKGTTRLGKPAMQRMPVRKRKPMLSCATAMT